jgi:hypothetical protein
MASIGVASRGRLIPQSSGRPGRKPSLRPQTFEGALMAAYRADGAAQRVPSGRSIATPTSARTFRQQLIARQQAPEAAGVEFTNGQSPGLRVSPGAIDRFTWAEASRPKRTDEGGSAPHLSKRKRGAQGPLAILIGENGGGPG